MLRHYAMPPILLLPLFAMLPLHFLRRYCWRDMLILMAIFRRQYMLMLITLCYAIIFSAKERYYATLFHMPCRSLLLRYFDAAAVADMPLTLPRRRYAPLDFAMLPLLPLFTPRYAIPRMSRRH